MKILNVVCIALGCICVGLGAIGVFLPILPTTPFFLAALFFFAKGSKRFHDWFIRTKLYQRHLERFVKTRSMTLATKLAILLPVTTMLVAAGVLVDVFSMRVVLAFLVAFKWWYFLCKIKTVKNAAIGG